jgi:hypothetical protein
VTIGEDRGSVFTLSSNQLSGSSEMPMKELGWFAIAVDEEDDDSGDEGSSDDSDDDDDDDAGGDGGDVDVSGDKAVVVGVFSDALGTEARERFK